MTVAPIVRRHMTISGIVQGVGFRPFVFRLARELSLTGWIANASEGVVVELEGRPEAAEPLFTKALSRRPQLASALYGLGRAALAKRDYGRAVKHLEEALAQDPLASSVHGPW